MIILVQELDAMKAAGLDPDVESVIASLTKKGAWSRLRIPENVGGSLYRIVSHGPRTNEPDLGEVIAEETDILATGGDVVRAYSDGSIRIEKKRKD